MRIFVTGGNGFIGANILRRLVKENHTVACFDINEPSPLTSDIDTDIRHIRGDITDPVQLYNAILDFEPDRVMHLAALLDQACENDARRALDVNVMGTATVLEAAAMTGIERVIAASSIMVYGEITESQSILDETVPQQPDNMYGLTKYVVQRLGKKYSDDHGTDFATVEPVHSLGPGRSRGNVYKGTGVLEAAVMGESISVPAIEQPYEIVSIRDVVDAFTTVLFANELPHDHYLVGSGEYTTIDEIVSIVKERYSDADIEMTPPKPSEQIMSRPPTDSRWLREDFGWTPQYSPREAVSAYLDWLEENPALY